MFLLHNIRHIESLIVNIGISITKRDDHWYNISSHFLQIIPVSMCLPSTCCKISITLITLVDNKLASESHAEFLNMVFQVLNMIQDINGS